MPRLDRKPGTGVLSGVEHRQAGRGATRLPAVMQCCKEAGPCQSPVRGEAPESHLLFAMTIVGLYYYRVVQPDERTPGTVDNYGNPEDRVRDLVLSAPAPGQPPVAPASARPDHASRLARPALVPDTPAELTAPAPRGYGIQMKRRSPAGVWLLALCTLGGYGLVWWYLIHAELREFDRRRHVSPVFELLSVSLLSWTIILPFMSVGSLAGRIRLAQSAAGLQQECSGSAGIGLAVAFGTHMIYYQRKLNGIIDANVAARGDRVQLKF